MLIPGYMHTLPSSAYLGRIRIWRISRVAVYAPIMELASMCFLTRRTSAVDRLDGPPRFRAAVEFLGSLIGFQVEKPVETEMPDY